LAWLQGGKTKEEKDKLSFNAREKRKRERGQAIGGRVRRCGGAKRRSVQRAHCGARFPLPRTSLKRRSASSGNSASPPALIHDQRRAQSSRRGCELIVLRLCRRFARLALYVTWT